MVDWGFYLLSYEQVFELVSGSMKMRHGGIPGNWAIYPNPEKAEGCLYGWCVKKRGEDLYSYHYSGSLLFREDKDRKQKLYTTCSKDANGKQHGSYTLEAEKALPLQKLIKEAKYVSTTAEVWPNHYTKESWSR